MRIALYQPDIAQNVGSIIRLSACFGVGLDIIEPCGFPFNLKRVHRAALDYGEHADISVHEGWEAFKVGYPSPARLLLLTTKGSVPYHRFHYAPDDILLFGRESAGVPDAVHAQADARIIIPIAPETRSLNIAQAAAITVAEALRQTDQLYEVESRNEDG